MKAIEAAQRRISSKWQVDWMKGCVAELRRQAGLALGNEERGDFWTRNSQPTLGM